MLDGTERNPPNPTYTCAVRMEHKGGYINWKKNAPKGIGTKKRKGKNTKKKKKKSKKREKELYRLPRKTIVVPTLDFQYTWEWVFLLYKSEPSSLHPRSTNHIVWAFLRANPTLLRVVTNRVLTEIILHLFNFSDVLNIVHELCIIILELWRITLS